jgi:hypothetical protein
VCALVEERGQRRGLRTDQLLHHTIHTYSMIQSTFSKRLLQHSR